MHCENHSRDHENHEQRPKAELKPATLAFRRSGFERLGLHGGIIRDRGQPSKEFSATLIGRDDSESFPAGGGRVAFGHLLVRLLRLSIDSP